MKGIDVYQLEYRGGETAIKLDYEPVTLSLSVPVRIKASAPTFEALMEAVKQNERELQESRKSAKTDGQLKTRRRCRAQINSRNKLAPAGRQVWSGAV